MTSRNLYEGVLIELNKENAPNILLEDFNYFANKAINNYINKRYNIYDVNQQTTDDLRVLKATALLTPRQVLDYSGLTMAGDTNMATYEVVMPSDYLHILNCICIYKVKKTYKCYNAGDTWRSPATRLTADMYSQVLDNFWNKPTYKRPYYYIHNVNTSNFVPTNPYGGRSFNLNESSNTSYQFFTYGEPLSSEGGGYLLGIAYNNKLYNVLTDGSNQYIFVNSNNCCYITAYRPDFRIANQLFNTTDGSFVVIDGIKIKILKSESGGSNTNNDDLHKVIGNITHFNSIEAAENYFYNSNNSQNVSVQTLDLGVDANHTSDSSTGDVNYGTDAFGAQIVQGEGLPRTINIMKDGVPMLVSNIERGLALRYGNVSQVRLEIRYGTDNQVFELKLVYVDYIKAPQNIRLTQQELDLTEDTSQMLEYPDYVCQEIINELVHLVMENISDQRLQTHPVVSLSIANPTQALTPQAALGQAAQ